MAPKPEVVSGPGMPVAGPYSPGVRAGDLLFVSGQAGLDPETAKPVGDTLAEQARQAFKNLEAVLRAGGSEPARVVNTTIIVADITKFGEVNDLFAEFFPDNPPARMTMEVGLPMGLLISIGCVATVQD
jgi:2-iminobutanoate/2-iminopropanoate deaminase